MSKCTLCQLGQYTDLQCLPRGTYEPKIYLIGEAPGRHEGEVSGRPFTGPSGQLLTECMDEIGLTEDNCRFFNIVRCVPYYDVNCRDDGVRAPSDEEKEVCSRFVCADIMKTKPRVIVTLGGTSTSYFLKDRFTSITSVRGKVYEIEIHGERYSLLPTFHPSYLIRNRGNSEIMSQFRADLKKARELAKDTLNDFKKKLFVAKSYDEFGDFYNTYCKDKEYLGYDLESNYKLTLSSAFKVVGMSLASDRSTGIYVPFYTLDFTMPGEEQMKIRDLTREILKKHRIIVHNQLFERPATLNENWLGIEIPNVEDTMMISRLLLGGERGAGLKERCQAELGYPDWETDTYNYMWALQVLCKYMKINWRGYTTDEHEMLKSGKTILDIWDMYKDCDNEKLSKKEYNIKYALSYLVPILTKYYLDPDVLQEKVKILSDRISTLIDMKITEPQSYEYVPVDIISKYGALDSVGAVDLYEHKMKELDKLSVETGVDLHKGYKYYKWQAYVGYSMEKFGVAWREDKVREDEEHLKKQCMIAHENMVRSPLSREYFYNNWKGYLTKYMFQNYPDVIKNTINISPVKEIYERYLVLQDESKITIDDFVKLFFNDIPRDVIDPIIDKCIDEQLAIVNSKDFYDTELLINPNSTHYTMKDFVNSILVDSEVKLARFLTLLRRLVVSWSFDPSNYYGSDKEFLVAVKDLVTNKDISNREKFLQFKSLLKGRTFESNDIISLRNDARIYKLEGTAEEYVLDLYETYEDLGVEIEKPETWDERFKWLFNFRLYKKCYKMISTYVNGSIGRENVWVVDKKAIQSKGVASRKRPYEFGKGIDLSNELYLYQSDFGVATTETGRWRAGLHTLPWRSCAETFFGSRYENGFLCHADFSQHEAVCMAAMGNEQNMLKGFREGLDLHKLNASLIFKVPIDEVQDIQRRYAKLTTFGAVYGETEWSLAEKHFDGDVSRSKEVLDSFFGAFPGIRKLIDEMHEIWKKTGRVPLPLVGRYINIVPANDSKSAYSACLRQAQNYPIQGTASDITALCIYQATKFIEDHNYLTCPFIFVHDGQGYDVNPPEMLHFVHSLKQILMDWPEKEFGVPTRTDIELGVSLGEMVAVKKFESSDDFNEGKLVLKGYEHNINNLLKKWEKAYRKVEVSSINTMTGYDPKTLYRFTLLDLNTPLLGKVIEEREGDLDVKVKDDVVRIDKNKILMTAEAEYVPYKDMFSPKRAYQINMGNYLYEVKKEVNIIIK